MRKPVQIAFALVFLGFVCLAVWQELSNREPVYQGERLSLWLDGYQFGQGSSVVDEAVKNIGTRAIPVLLEMLRARDSSLKLKLADFGLPYTPAEIKHMRAAKAFGALGSVASNAVPALVQIFEQSPSASSHHAAADALVAVGPSAGLAIPAILRAASDTNSEERAFAVSVLGRLSLQPAVAIPRLIKALGDPEPEVRFNAASAIGTFVSNRCDARAEINPGRENRGDSP